MDIESTFLVSSLILLLAQHALSSGCCSKIITVGPDVIDRQLTMDDARRTYLDESTPLPEGQLVKFRAFVKYPGRSDARAQFGVWSHVGLLTYKTEYVFNVTFQQMTGIQEFTVPDTVHVKNGSLFGVTFFGNTGFITHNIDVDNGRLMLTDHFTMLPSINNDIKIIYANYFHAMSLQVDVAVDQNKTLGGRPGPPGPAGMTGVAGPAGATGPRGATGPAAVADINQCLRNNGGCGMRCVDTEHGYHCECDPGYTLNTDRQTCRNVNECLVDNGGCSHFCNDTIGSYNCSCRHGFALSKNNRECEDIDECQFSEACLTGRCINTVGNYTCILLGLHFDEVEGTKSKTAQLKSSPPYYNNGDDEDDDDYNDKKKGINSSLFTVIWLSVITALVVGLGVANIRYCRKHGCPGNAQGRTSRNNTSTSQEPITGGESHLTTVLYI